MRKWKKYKGRALAVVLAAALAGGAVTVPGVLAEKTEESSDSDDPGEDADQADDAANDGGHHRHNDGVPDTGEVGEPVVLPQQGDIRSQFKEFFHGDSCSFLC